MIEETTTPPIFPEPLEAPPSRWPTVIGIFSLVYAIGGLFCQLSLSAWMVLGDQIPEMFRGGINLPPIVRITGLAQVFCVLILGICMLIGAVNLLRRKRAGHTMLRNWAIVRVVFIVIGILIAVLTAPAQLQMQKDSVEWQKRYFKEQNIAMTVPEYTDEQLWHKAILSSGVAAAVFSIYPIFIVFYLSRKKIMTEVRDWR